MANLVVKDGAAADKYLKSSGAGSDVDPHIPQHLETNSAAILTAVQAATPAGTNAIGKLAANSGVDIGDVDVTSISAGENHLGSVGFDDTVLDLTLSLDTSAYALADVLADTQSLASASRVNAGVITVTSVLVLDEDDQKQPMVIVFLDANNSLGTENSGPNISDANARNIIGWVRISASDYEDFGGASVAVRNGLGLKLKLAAATTTLYVGVISGGTGTYTASGIRLKIGVERS